MYIINLLADFMSILIKNLNLDDISVYANVSCINCVIVEFALNFGINHLNYKYRVS